MAKEAIRTISIRVNDVAPGKSIKKIKAEFKELRQTVEGATEKNEQYYKDVARLGQLKGAINNHNKQVRRIAKGWDETSTASKKSKSSFKDALGSFLNFKNLTVAGLATTLVGAAAAFGNEVIQVSKEINQLRGDIQNLTDLSGANLEDATAKARALGLAFEADTQEIVLAANAMSNEFGISFNESLELIEKGFLAGADANGEFLSQMKEYPAQFSAAGASAENFVEIVTRSTKEGVFSDKGADVVKEFGLRIRDVSSTGKKAMNDAFGKEFTNELFGNINSGAITTQQALQKVAGKMNDTEIPANQLQAVVSNIFGGPGEDAGVNFIKSLEDVGKGMDAQIDTSNDLTQQRMKQLEAEEELAKVQTQLSAEVQQLTTGTGVLVTKLKTGLLQIVVAVIRQFQNFIKTGKNVYNNIGFIKTGVDVVVSTFKGLFGLITQSPQIFNGVGNALKQLGDNFLNYFRNLRSQAVIAIEEAKNIVGKGDNSLINAEKQKIKARKDGKSVKEAFIEGFNEKTNIPNVEVKTESNSKPLPRLTGGAASVGSGTSNAGVSKTEVDKNKENLKQLQSDIDKFREQERLKQLSENDREIEAINAKYAKQIEAARQLKGEESEEFKTLVELRNNEIAAKEAEHLAAIEAAEKESIAKRAAAKLEKDKEYREAKNAIEGEIELELMGDLERELAAIDAHYDALIEEAKEYGVDLSIIKELQAKQDDERDKASLKVFKERLNERATAMQSLGSIFGSVAQLMVDEEGNALAAQKVFALAEIAMNAASGISGAIAAGAGIPFPGNLAAIATGVGAVVTGIAQARAVFAQQKKDGGYVKVTGADDNKQYNAKRIGKVSTGMLPSSPVLLQSEVLASEAGKEYFVSNKSLQNPAVMDLVRMIDNIENGRSVMQFKTGGAVGSSITGNSSLLTQVLTAITSLNQSIKNGVAVNIGYKEIEKMNKLSDDLNQIK